MTDGLLAAEQNLSEPLSPEQLLGAATRTLRPLGRVRKVLLIHPDYSRTDFSDVLFRMIYRLLSEQGMQRLDTLNAAGTHRPMTLQEKLGKLGVADRSQFPALGDMLDHSVEPDELVDVGRICPEFMKEKTRGLWSEPIPVKVSRRLKADYDLVIALSGTVPHESAGYAGGLKAFFPGIAGREVIEGLHWAAVQMGIPNLIGQVDNPGRDVINEGAKLMFAACSAKVVSFNMLFREEDHSVAPHGLYTGLGYDGFIAAYRAAASASAQIHLVRIPQALGVVVQALGEGYDEVWTGGKGSYKLQMPGVMAPGGEIILYQPKITCFHSNAAMDRTIRELGYHSVGYVLHRLEERPDFDRNVASHVINVRGTATYDRASRRESDFAFHVTLATAIPEQECRAVGLGYRDPATLEREFDRLPGNKLWVKNGGKMLYARA